MRGEAGVAGVRLKGSSEERPVAARVFNLDAEEEPGEELLALGTVPSEGDAASGIAFSAVLAGGRVRDSLLLVAPGRC